MAAATTILAGAGTALGIGGSIGKAIGGAKQKRAARRAARNFKRQELRNVNRGRRISTRGAEIQKEMAAQRTATSVEALRSGGVRGVVGGLGQVNNANIRQSQAIGANLDQQQVQLDREIAADEARIRAMQENRDNMELNAIQQQMNAGNQQMYSGIGDAAQIGFGLAGSSLFDPKSSGVPLNAQATPFGTIDPRFLSGDNASLYSGTEGLV